MNYGAHKQGRASLVATGSATVFSLATAGRWAVQKGIISISLVTGSAVWSLQEASSGGTSAAVLMAGTASAKGNISFDFGEKGYSASATDSRLILNLQTSNSTVYCTAVGYSRQ